MYSISVESYQTMWIPIEARQFQAAVNVSVFVVFGNMDSLSRMLCGVMRWIVTRS